MSVGLAGAAPLLAASSSAVPAAAAPFLAATALLAGAGAAKLWNPLYTARALAAAGLPAHRHLVRAGAAGELVVAVAAIAWPGVLTGALVAAAYGAFAAFVAVALHRGWALSSCGCFGRPDSRPAWPHVVLDALAAAAAGVWAVTAPARIGRLFSPGQPWHGIPLALVAAVIAGLAWAIWTNPIGEARR